MRTALVALALAFALSAASLELAKTIDVDYTVAKLKTDMHKYIVIASSDFDMDTDYCCGYSYELFKDEVTIYEVYGLSGLDSRVKKGVIELKDKYDTIIATDYGFVVCNVNNCTAYSRTGNVVWKAPLKIDLDVTTHSFLPFINGTMYLVGKDQRTLYIVDSKTGELRGVLRLDFKVQSISNCDKYILLVGKDEIGNSVLELYEVETDGDLTMLWKKVTASDVYYSSVSDDCRYAVVSTPTTFYVLNVPNGDVIVSRDITDELLLFANEYRITSIEMTPLTSSGLYAIIVGADGPYDLHKILMYKYNPYEESESNDIWG
ncbi:hypothetical protein EYM_00890 [Ignicoccus islandicus DSM 13165]|uniref:Uncharacterized protein n=1 Tax=Ignicoccus islandicus DSM 13165 TaxID=940295 RepID=A0A0U3F7Z5_9CREN|nr:hypothetical protein [Ignicoccus islandicus]ALU12152.1 hypothetical protein EYM_00890 [Ignicoccus islandicus DSM 13165]